jgi:hypothetical protein
MLEGGAAERSGLEAVNEKGEAIGQSAVLIDGEALADGGGDTLGHPADGGPLEAGHRLQSVRSVRVGARISHRFLALGRLHEADPARRIAS